MYPLKNKEIKKEFKEFLKKLAVPTWYQLRKGFQGEKE